MINGVVVDAVNRDLSFKKIRKGESTNKTLIFPGLCPFS